MDDREAMDLLGRVYAVGNGYFSREHGCQAHHVPATIVAEALQGLAERGLAPNSFRRFTHDEAVTGLRGLAAGVAERAAADAFVASLASAELRWRTLLPAVAVGMTMPAHPYAGRGPGRVCDVCFVDATVTVDVTGSWWRRRVFGSPLPGDVCQYLLALESATAEAASPWPAPAPYDVWVLHQLLDVLRSMPPTARSTPAADALREQALLPTSSKYAYLSLLEDLALLGVLQTPDHPGVLTCFTTARKRDERPSPRVEVSAPLSFWTGAHGVNEALVDRLFGHLTRPGARPDPPTPSSGPRASGGTKRAAALPTHLRGAPQAGDVYAVRCREDAWVLAYCHQIEQTNGRPYGLVEYLDAFFTRMPTPDDVASGVAAMGFRGRSDRRWQQRTSHLDKTTGVRRIARAVAPPSDQRPPPDRIGAGSAKDLWYLAASCFDELG